MKIWDYRDYQINSLIIKSSDYCNLRCSYCYQKERNKNKVMHIDIGMMEKLIRDYFSFAAKNNQDDSLYIVWHGGEPLMCGLDFFKNIVEIEKSICKEKEGRVIYNAVQTNGTLLNEEYIKFFKENKFGIGISIDGIPEHHDKKRCFADKRGSSNLIHKNIKLLKENNLKFSAICVISRQSIGHAQEYYDYFKNLQVTEVDFIPSFFQGSNENLNEDEYSDFLCSLFDLYYGDNNRTMNIRVFDDILRAILTSRGINCGSIGCEYAGRCGENISISVNGDVYPCDCLTTIKKMRVGNIRENSLEEIFNDSNESFFDFKNSVNEIDNKCLECDVFKVCKGGCFNRRLQDLTGCNIGMDIYCNSRYKIIKYIGDKCNGQK